MNILLRGRREVEHTADLELEVWGPDLAALLEEAGRGLYELMGVEISEEARRHRRLEFSADEPEQLLVSLLEELVYLAESEEIAFDGFLFSVDGSRAMAHLEGGRIVGRRRDIKAVTYHGLEILSDHRGLRANIVFDV